jgi:hypothetical protein
MLALMATNAIASLGSSRSHRAGWGTYRLLSLSTLQTFSAIPSATNIDSRVFHNTIFESPDYNPAVKGTP